jgi:hypothetical protein
MENNSRNRHSINRTVISAVTIQSGKGQSGVDLRGHSIKEYKSLNDAQRDELKSWRNSNEGKASIAASKKQYLDEKKRTPGVVAVVVVMNVNNMVITMIVVSILRK